MYNDIYALFQGVLYGSAPLTGYMEGVLTAISTIAVLFVAVVPFLIVWKVIQLIVGR